ncbi:siderophore-interacting protein [Aeromicrobium sp. CTD01-1L150]|uniref:siderophore-interacting protein n=1 Tax=Aeromicrobium sp. CTD01-1L150 TaxID=3341830 RepID=UPI0035C1345A
MGRTLAFIADRVDATAHPASVAVTEELSPGLRRIVLRSRAFAEVATDPCDVTAFRVSRVDYRHYTPALLDPVGEGGDLTIIVQRHGDQVDEPTPGHDLIESWRVGDDVLVSRWSSTRAFRWESDDAPVVLLGDATVISLAMAMERRTAAEGRDLVAVLEVPPEDVEAAQLLVPRSTVISAGPRPGVAVDAWLAQNVEALRLLDSPRAYVAGHGQSIQRQRCVLRDIVGLDRRSVKTQPYWATGKAGL